MKTLAQLSFSRDSRSRLCKLCVASSGHQYLSSAAPPTRNPPPPPSAGFARLSNRALISIHGRDAAHYLQGLTTSNIQTSTPQSQQGFYSAFLNAQGRVLHDVFIYPSDHSSPFRASNGRHEYQEPGFLIDVDQYHAMHLYAHLKRYKLRAKVSLRIVDTDEWNVWGTWDGNETHSEHTSASNPQLVGCTDARAPGMGQRIVTYDNESPEISSGEETSVDTYDIRRLLNGIPQGHDEIISGDALPQESNIDYMGGIDFRKGCYVGQELTIRTHHTGVVRKRMLPVQLYAIDEKPPGTLRYDPESSLVIPSVSQNIGRVNTRGRSAGRWMTGIGNIGLALCRLETMTDIRLTEEASQWTPEHEFKVSWQPDSNTEERELKIKAFVPEWHRNRVSVRERHRQQND
ncbi:MAG: hypothetical protein Q9170_004758 [Blastenia crenularia]